ncbi:cupin domain-containing protein [Enterovirga aerilata]|uniref:Cupin domain-containing protein n=1 Tax=Enterovirga aerilata TaxID=2730920 RepID=A0A849I542_9HYPH|nr:cupin domain-containing protein [Enterovirga sp. DB1703]NNM74562.1 cupin domain-containing protein [Enterovirga sp. DB1703]
MDVLDHGKQEIEVWRDGVNTRMRVSALTNSHQLLIFEQFCDPGHGAPMHIHAVEEVLEVVEGVAEISLGDSSRVVSPDQSVVVPAGMRHGFKNIGDGILKVRATMAAPIFEASYDVRGEIARRYSPS